MSDITKNITKHYQSIIGGELEKYHIEEWDMDIYFRKTYALHDEIRIVELQNKGKTVEAMVESLLIKARDKHGKRLFQDAHRETLLREADPAVVLKCIAAINSAGVRAPVEEEGKELEPTQK